MWTRADIKTRGKFAFKKSYWASVLVSLILVIATGGSGAATGFGNSSSTSNTGSGSSAMNALSDPQNLKILAIIAGVAGIAGLVGLVLSICIWHPLEVGGRRYFMENRESDCKLDAVLYAFKSGNYGNVVLTMFLQKLFITLWSLLLVIPGIIKSYEYRMIPYILSENPGMNYKDAFSISKNMMSGQKWDAFVLDLSFIGWYLLTGLTCGIVGIFYVNPYIYATNAELYAVLRTHAFQVGGVTTNELPGFLDVY